MKERNTRALVGTPYEEHPQHCWRKGGAAVHKWVGLPLDVGQLWGRWGSRRVAVDYVPPPPPTKFNLHAGMLTAMAVPVYKSQTESGLSSESVARNRLRVPHMGTPYCGGLLTRWWIEAGASRDACAWSCCEDWSGHSEAQSMP